MLACDHYDPARVQALVEDVLSRQEHVLKSARTVQMQVASPVCAYGRATQTCYRRCHLLQDASAGTSTMEGALLTTNADYARSGRFREGLLATARLVCSLPI